MQSVNVAQQAGQQLQANGWAAVLQSWLGDKWHCAAVSVGCAWGMPSLGVLQRA